MSGARSFVARMQTPAARGALAVLLLRLGLGWFLLVWGVTKFLAPGHYVKLYAYFHGFDLAASLPYYMGAGQTVVAVAIILGLWRRASYAAGLLIHTITVAVVIGELVTPFVIEKGFPAHRNQTIALAAWGGFLALYLLRDLDRWSLDGWLTTRRAKREGAGKST